jgi:hypothetical protein
MNVKTKHLWSELQTKLSAALSPRDLCFLEISLAEAEMSGYTEAAEKCTDILKRLVNLNPTQPATTTNGEADDE